MNYLVAYAVVITGFAIWQTLELKAERAAARMVDEFRENDRKFYRGWEEIWFQQLRAMPSTRKTKAAKPKPKRKS